MNARKIIYSHHTDIFESFSFLFIFFSNNNNLLITYNAKKYYVNQNFINVDNIYYFLYKFLYNFK